MRANFESDIDISGCVGEEWAGDADSGADTAANSGSDSDADNDADTDDDADAEIAGDVFSGYVQYDFENTIRYTNPPEVAKIIGNRVAFTASRPTASLRSMPIIGGT